MPYSNSQPSRSAVSLTPNEKPIPVRDDRDISRRRIVLRDGELMIHEGHSLTVSVGRHVIHVGCTTISIEAWRHLQKEVDDLLDGELAK